MSWKGWYEQYGKQSPMNFTNFQAVPQPGGPIQGGGVDEVGQF
jgi:hypothetical protein